MLSDLKVMAALQEAAETSASGPQPRPETASTAIELWDAAGFAASLQRALNPCEWFLNINTPEDWDRAQQFRSD